jgi:hypothetical protein
MPEPDVPSNLISASVRWVCRIHGVTGTPQYCAFCRQQYGGHTMRFEALFKTYPDLKEISDVQKANGYHPAGYGGPWRLIIEEHAEGHSAIWYCSDNCE